MHRVRTTILSAGAAALLLGACGSDGISETIAEQAIEQGGGGDADVDINDDGSFSFESDEGSYSIDEDGNVQIESEDGSFSLDSQGGEIPDDFPDIPLPDGFTVQSSAKQDSGGETVFNVVGSVDGDPQDVYADVVDQFDGEGFAVDNEYESNSAGQFAGGATFSDSDHQVNVSVSTNPAGEGAFVAVTVTPASE